VIVVPAKAGTQFLQPAKNWMPAFDRRESLWDAGMTV